MGDQRAGFLKYAREGPKGKPIELRVLDWKENVRAHPGGEAQGSRRALHGLRCALLPRAIPVVPGREFHSGVERSRLSRALERCAEGIAPEQFPGIHRPTLSRACEGACALGINSDPVSIRVLEWNIIDRGFNEGLVPTPALPVRKTETVAIIGSGPRRSGCRATIRARRS